VGARNFLVEGVSGAGKTSVCDELSRRGYSAINGDRALAYQGDPSTGVPVHGLTGTAVHDHHIWRVDTVHRYADDRSDPVTFFCGGARNVGQFVDVFDEVFILTIDAATLDRRLDARDVDEWAGRGRSEEQALVRQLHATSANDLAGIVIDATRPLSVVVDEILRRCGLTRH
jgi:hypothetical protein